MIDIEPTKLANWFELHRYRKTTPIIVALIVIMAWLVVVSQADFSDIRWPHYAIGGLLLFTVVVVFACLRRIPRRRNKKAVGFLVAIAVYDRKGEQQIQQDLIDTLRGLLTHSSHKYPFELVVLPNYYSKRILGGADPQYYFDKTGCHFMVTGRARIADSQSTRKHVLDLRGLVRHKPLPTEALGELRRDFSELLPRRIAFSTGIALEGFELTADCIMVVSKYIISMAAGQSGDLAYARSLLEELQAMRPQLTRRPPPEQEVLRRVPARLAEVYTHIAARELTRWREDHLPDRITVIQSLLDKIDALHLTSYLPTLLRSICLFLRHDVRSSMAELRKCKGELELTWRVNLAFLYAYEGDLNSARREMQIAARGQLSEATPNQAEQFILWVLDEEPEKTHLWYLLGLINYLLKGDFDQAQADFKRFLSVADRTCFGSAVQHAQTLARKVPAAAT